MCGLCGLWQTIRQRCLQVLDITIDLGIVSEHRSRGFNQVGRQGPHSEVGCKALPASG